MEIEGHGEGGGRGEMDIFGPLLRGKMFSFYMNGGLNMFSFQHE